MSIYKAMVLAFLLTLAGQIKSQSPNDPITIDDNGVMHWSSDGSEIHGFGVNYTLPFAHEYRMAIKASVSHEKAIDEDVYHMARLDLDLYRVHVWDTEISDTLGNLLTNDHLRLFDYAVNEMKKRGMKFVITPIAFWGNGWPERDEHTPGFSYKYGKEACLTNPDAIKAQANYLNQLLNHVNHYTGIAYKDEPSLIAFEISNEPHHDGTKEQVTAYINTMVASMRETGCAKPIFYNMSHSIHLGDAYFDSNIQGGTFQWYPTNLVANQQINGNFLPHVQQYQLPYANEGKFKKMAKIVYEFDPADVGSTIMYPAMAQTFRETGFQLATQFAYDAMCWAPYNTNYGTHFMNLAYAPQKAISLKIASAVFHQFPLYQKPANELSNAIRISYKDDLAEWNTSDKFFYTNNTTSQPLDPTGLKEVAGYGSSPVVIYDGTGAYFLDKLEDGVWRLEVMPDAYWVKDPYTKVSPNVQKTAVQHALRKMSVLLPNLGNGFSAKPINKGNSYQPQINDNHMELMPGVYVLMRNGINKTFDANQKYKNITVGEYVAPESNLGQTALWNHTPTEVVADKATNLVFKAASPSAIRKISVVMSMGDKWKTVTATSNKPNQFIAEIPNDMLNVGFLNYRIMVETDEGTTTFPKGIKGDIWSWDNIENDTYNLRIVPANSQMEIWDAQNDWEASYKIWNRAVGLKPTSNGGTALAIKLNQLPNEDPLDKDNRNYAFKFFFGNKTNGRADEYVTKKTLVLKASNNLKADQPIEIGLIDKNGSVMVGQLELKSKTNIYKLELGKFKHGTFLIIPRPYPDFLPYSVLTSKQPFDWSAIETLQVIVKQGQSLPIDLKLEKIWLE